MAESPTSNAIRLRKLRIDRPGWNRTKNAKWKAENALKHQAHKLVERALLKGELTKQSCERCGATHLVHAHHDDYSRPLDVRWLCPTDHRARHREINEIKVLTEGESEKALEAA